MALYSLCLKAQTITGELRKWHKIELSFDIGKNITETNNTFRNHRLDVVFKSPSGNSYRVPGFFAADGNAENSNATSGSIFKAILRPNEIGIWTYELLYYEGNNVALSTVNTLPSPTRRITGDIGTISRSNKTGVDLRAKGRLLPISNGNNNQKRYLRFSETGEYFLKLGPDSPENILHYHEFDSEGGGGNNDEHRFTPHVSDFKNGDPTWDGGKGRGIIGALNYLRNEKMNSFSMSLFGGDDRSVSPWLRGDSQFNQNKFIYDISKLAQWEVVFDHAEEQGLMMHYKLSESENSDRITGDIMRIFYREMVARFGHHLAIEWNISEEYGGPDGIISGSNDPLPKINWLADIDPWQNHRVLHTYPGRHNKIYNYLLSNNAKLTGASIQTSNNIRDGYNGDSGILTWINNSRENGIPWAVASDEQNSGRDGVFTNADINNKQVDSKRARVHVLWKTLIAGGIGVMWYGGSQGDFRTENFDRFSTLFNWTRIAIIDFFKKYNLNVWKMSNKDNLVSGSANCLAEEGKSYIILLENGGSTNLNLNRQSGNYTVKWFDPRNGGDLRDGNIRSISGGGNRSIGNPPSNANLDWVALITNEPITSLPVVSNPTPPTTNENCDFDFEEKNNIVVIETENLNTTGTSWEIKSDRDGFSGSSFIEWLGNDSFGTPGNGIITTKIRINSPGKYEFRWRSRVGKGNNSTEHNDSWLRFPDASDFYAERDTNRIFPKGSGKSPNPAGAGSNGWFKVYLSSSTDWTWVTSTSDFDAHRIFAEFDTAGIYTMEISGRSKNHLIDRVVLFKNGVTNPQGLNREETICSGKNNPTPPVTPPTTGNCNNSSILDAISDFTNRNITGFSSAYVDNDRNAVGINAAQFKNVFAAATTTFNGITGTYNLKLNTLTELDGESEYRISINGVTQREVFQNPRIFGTGSPDYTPASNIWENIALNNGDEIRVEFNSVTNGEIAEGNGTAFSRGRWVSIEINCSNTPSAPTPPAVPTPPTSPTTSNCNENITVTVDQDAYLQNDTAFNNTELRVESGKRETYLKFRIPNTPGVLTSVKLQLSVGSDSGSGIIEIIKGTSNNWNEANISSTNRPQGTAVIGSLNSNYNLNTAYEWELSDITPNQTISLIVRQTNGNDVSFVSKEGGAKAPKLILTYSCSTPTPTVPSLDLSEQLIVDGAYYIGSTTSNQRLVSRPNDDDKTYMTNPSNRGIQKWIFTHQGDNVYTIKNQATEGFLEVPFAKCANNEQVATYTSALGDHQKWKISVNNSGNFILKPLHCLTQSLDRNFGRLNTNVITYSFNINNNNQKWEIIPVGARFDTTNSANLNTDILLFPNPTSEKVNIINLTIGQHITINNLTGKKLYETIAKSEEVSIPVFSFATGLYIVTILNKDSSDVISVEKLFIN